MLVLSVVVTSLNVDSIDVIHKSHPLSSISLISLSLYYSMFIQVLSCQTEHDCAASFLLFADASRCLVHCGAGTQRFAVEHGVRLARLSHVLLATSNWSEVAGLPGLLLTVADSGLPRLRLAAPRGLARTLVAARTFLHRPQCTLLLSQYGTSDDVPVVQTPGFSVFAVVAASAASVVSCEHLLPMTQLDLSKLRSDPCGCATAARDKTRAVAFVVHADDIPGKFDPVRSDALGIPAGPLRAALVRGESVVSPASGATVAPADCISAVVPGRIAVICVVHTIADLNALVASNLIAVRYHANRTFADRVVVVLHTAPRALFMAPPYVAWRERFSAHVQHRWAHADAGPLCQVPPFVGSTLYQRALHSVAPAVFRVYQGENDATVAALPDLPAQARAAYEVNGVAPHLSKFMLAPLKRVGVDPASLWHLVDAKRTKQDKFADASTPLQQQRHARVAALLEQLRVNPLAPLLLREPTLRVDNPSITFLGTGSALPSKCRNVTGILLRMSPERCMFLDCGEGSLGQLRRALEPADVESALRTLCCVWISHRHPDHHLGLEDILVARRAVVGTHAAKLAVIAPRSMHDWLSQITEPIDFLPCDTLSGSVPLSERHVQTAALCGVASLITVPVNHIGDSHGIVLRHAQWSLAFSGDTTPCPALVQAAADVTVLIHEATLEDGMEADALQKCHTTTSQALQVALNARAQYLILTHFSQRYPKIPALPPSAFADHVIISFDLMTVHLDQLPALPLLTPVLTELLEEANEADGDNTADDNNSIGDDNNTGDHAMKKAKRKL
jgi:ribonuclease Z